MREAESAANEELFARVAQTAQRIRDHLAQGLTSNQAGALTDAANEAIECLDRLLDHVKSEKGFG